MGHTKQQHIEMMESQEGIPMHWRAPIGTSTTPVDNYSLHEFEHLTMYHSKLKPEIRDAILDAIKDYKRVIDSF